MEEEVYLRKLKTIRVCIKSLLIIVVIFNTHLQVSYGADMFNVYKDKTSTYKGQMSKLHKVASVSSKSKLTKGHYPTRKGVILVTSTGKVANVVGHTAIIYSSGYVIEALKNGVVIRRNNWNTTKTNMAAVTVRNSTAKEDAKVSDWCKKQKNKKYNYDYYNMNTNKKYYCSQLIWAGYKNLFKIDLNTKAYDTSGKKAIGPYEFVRKSSSKVYPIYIKKWNRNDVTD